MSCNFYLTENVYLNVQTLDIQECGHQCLSSRVGIQILNALGVPGSPFVIRFHYFVIYISHRRIRGSGPLSASFSPRKIYFVTMFRTRKNQLTAKEL